MANLTLLDTGYASVQAIGEMEESANIANYDTTAGSGVALELFGVSIAYNHSANTDATSRPDTYDNVEVNLVSSNNPTLIISGNMTSRFMENAAGLQYDTDLTKLKELDKMVKTPGIKCVYYNDTLGAEDGGYPLLTKFLGESAITDSNEPYTNHPTEPHFHVRFKSFKITQKAESGKYGWQLEAEVVGLAILTE